MSIFDEELKEKEIDIYTMYSIFISYLAQSDNYAKNILIENER